MHETERIAVFIDGFNVYYGFKRKGWERYLWLDYRKVFDRLVRPGQELVEVNYFTALSNEMGAGSGSRPTSTLSTSTEGW